MQHDVAFKLSEEFLDAYDANDDGEKLNALRNRLGLQGETCVLAGMFKHVAEGKPV